MKYFSNKIAAIALAATMFGACTEESPITNPPVENTPIEIDRTTFAKGADVSWITQFEAQGYTFQTSELVETECMQLLRDECGVNSIRLRVWVNPSEGWNNIDDVMIKARRANSLGLRVMIDFHFSDTWADPGAQETPAAWANYDLAGLQAAMVEHINEMLNKLNKYGIEPEWVQLGNETRNGMMYPLGNINDNPGNFSKLISAGYDAVKAIFPDCKVIVHCDSGNEARLYTRLFGNELKTYEGKYDLIGMSLYPDASTWSTTVSECLTNIQNVYNAYGKRVMICEIGMDYDQAAACNAMLTALKSGCESLGCVDGIFYWEPEATVENTGGYRKGCFVDGTPTEALDCFKN
jgi:arabinogalactan endo-1,4-beta-galactosidase